MAEKSKALKRRTYHREDEVRELIAENITNIRDWAGQGLSNGQIAAKFGVTNSASRFSSAVLSVSSKTRSA